MDKLITVNFVSYRVGESFEFNRIAAEEFAKCTNPLFLPFAERHKTALNVFDESLKKTTFTVESEQLANFDYYRDNAIMTTSQLIDRSMRCGVPEREEAAKRLNSIFNRYGQITSLPYMEENGIVENLIQDLEKTEAATDLETIGAAIWKDDIKKWQNDFVTLFNSRNAEAGAVEAGLTKEARIATEAAYKDCAQCLNTLVLMEGAEQYAPIITTLNNLIERQKSVIKARKTNNKEKTN